MKKFSPEALTDNVFKLIGTDYFLITAGRSDSFNTMTAGWGGLGVLWNKPVAITFIRPTRYTFGFANENEGFTLCFFDKGYRKALQYCGSHSGRDVDKMKATGLTPLITDLGNIAFEQARLVIECRKIYYDDLKPEHFLISSIDSHYPLKDYHRFFIGEIVNVLLNPNYSLGMK